VWCCGRTPTFQGLLKRWCPTTALNVTAVKTSNLSLKSDTFSIMGVICEFYIARGSVCVFKFLHGILFETVIIRAIALDIVLNYTDPVRTFQFRPL